MIPASAVAKYPIQLATADPEGDPMTAMRLHKLLYYCQGWHLAWFGRPLFPERLEARELGQVVPAIQDLPWGHGRHPLAEPETPINLGPDPKAAIEQVWSHFRKFSACGRRDQTQSEPPWKNHYNQEDPSASEIPIADLAAFFGKEYQRLTGDDPGSAGRFEAELAAGCVVTLEQLQQEMGV